MKTQLSLSQLERKFSRSVLMEYASYKKTNLFSPKTAVEVLRHLIQEAMKDQSIETLQAVDRCLVVVFALPDLTPTFYSLTEQRQQFKQFAVGFPIALLQNQVDSGKNLEKPWLDELTQFLKKWAPYLKHATPNMWERIVYKDYGALHTDGQNINKHTKPAWWNHVPTKNQTAFEAWKEWSIVLYEGVKPSMVIWEEETDRTVRGNEYAKPLVNLIMSVNQMRTGDFEDELVGDYVNRAIQKMDWTLIGHRNHDLFLDGNLLAFMELWEAEPVRQYCRNALAEVVEHHPVVFMDTITQVIVGEKIALRNAIKMLDSPTPDQVQALVQKYWPSGIELMQVCLNGFKKGIDSHHHQLDELILHLQGKGKVRRSNLVIMGEVSTALTQWVQFLIVKGEREALLSSTNAEPLKKTKHVL
jgi:hypothetical protein